MHKSGHPENNWLQALVAALPALLMLLALPALGWYGDHLKDEVRRQQLTGSEVLAAAQELRALAAELAAWQLAGALELERDAGPVPLDGGYPRRQFLQKARALRQRFAQAEPDAALADADPAELRLLVIQLDELLRLDARAIEAVAAAEAGLGRQAYDAAWSGAAGVMDSLLRGIDQLASMRAQRSRQLARTLERTQAWSSQMQLGALALALVLGGLLLAMLQRWIRLSRAYVAQLGRLTMSEEGVRGAPPETAC
jgi:hypothetical protein